MQLREGFLALEAVVRVREDGALYLANRRTNDQRANWHPISTGVRAGHGETL